VPVQPPDVPIEGFGVRLYDENGVGVIDHPFDPDRQTTGRPKAFVKIVRKVRVVFGDCRFCCRVKVMGPGTVTDVG
jgi:hypothetical protein